MDHHAKAVHAPHDEGAPGTGDRLISDRGMTRPTRLRLAPAKRSIVLPCGGAICSLTFLPSPTKCDQPQRDGTAGREAPASKTGTNGNTPTSRRENNNRHKMTNSKPEHAGPIDRIAEYEIERTNRDLDGWCLGTHSRAEGSPEATGTDAGREDRSGTPGQTSRLRLWND